MTAQGHAGRYPGLVLAVEVQKANKERAELRTRDFARPLPLRSWLVPESVKVKDGLLLYGPSTLDRQMEPGLAHRFGRLATRSDDQIAEFARRWGVLGLCADHGFPTAPAAASGRIDVNHPLGPQAFDEPRWHDRNFCAPPSSAPWVGAESFDAWRDWARAATGVIEAVQEIDLGNKVEKSIWEQMGVTMPRTDDRQTLAVFVNWWLDVAGVQPQIRWAEVDSARESPELVLVPSGLFGALGLQLVAVISGTSGFAWCSYCGEPYQPSKKPQAGRRNYCPDHRDIGRWHTADRNRRGKSR